MPLGGSLFCPMTGPSPYKRVTGYVMGRRKLGSHGELMSTWSLARAAAHDKVHGVALGLGGRSGVESHQGPEGQGAQGPGCWSIVPGLSMVALAKGRLGMQRWLCVGCPHPQGVEPGLGGWQMAVANRVH